MNYVIFDTNILIYREDPKKLTQDMINLGKTFSELNNYKIVIHPITIVEAQETKNAKLRGQILSKLKTYKVLEGPMQADDEFKSLFGKLQRKNDLRDLEILHSLYRGEASYIITNDKKMIKRSKIINLEKYVLSIEDAIEKFSVKDTDDYNKPIYISKKRLGQIKIEDPFFSTLKEDYNGFEKWYQKKAKKHKEAYVTYSDDMVGSFLMLKVEDETEEFEGYQLKLSSQKRVKISTFKISEKGKRLGERYMKIAIDFAIQQQVNEIYVTVFDKYRHLIRLFSDFGFKKYTSKRTIDLNGIEHEELVYIKNLSEFGNCNNVDLSIYPNINIIQRTKAYIIPIQPEYHEKLFPDYRCHQISIFDILGTTYESFAIKKVYISASKIQTMAPGDILLFYRSKDTKGVTSVGVVEYFYKELDYLEDFEDIVHKRTAYTEEEYEAIFEQHKIIVLFRHHFDLISPLSYTELSNLNILNGPPQTITNISLEKVKTVCKNSKFDEVRKFVNLVNL